MRLTVIKRILGALVPLLLTAMPSWALDLEKQVSFSIPAQKLDAALVEFSKQARLQIITSGEEVKDFNSAGATGTLSISDALNNLLGNSGLSYRAIGDSAISIGRFKAGPRISNLADAPTRLVQENTQPSTTNQQATPPSGEPEQEPKSSIQEIVVTAQRREERLEEVPISISVMTGEQLDSSTLMSLRDIMNRVPGVAAIQAFLGSPIINVRGVPFIPGAGHTIGFYVDSVPFGFTRHSIYPDINLYDLERMEVLRGPQGTLYGANSVNGVVRLLTQAPDLNRFEAKTRATFGTIKDGGENYRADAAVNIPLIEDRLAMRLVGGYQELGGWIDKPIGEDSNHGSIKTLRAKLRAQPTEALTLDATAWFNRRFIDAQDLGRENRTARTPIDEPTDSDFDTFSLVAAYDFGAVSLTSATSYLDYALDLYFSLHDFFPAGTFQNSNVFAEVFSEELTLQSTQDGPWRWSLGAMYRDAKDRDRIDLSTGVLLWDFDTRSKSYAMFGEVTREFLDGKVEATLGGRYFYEEFSTAQNINPGGGALVSAEDTSDAVTPRAVLAWHPTAGSTVYASYAQGFRGGLPQTPATLGNPLFAGSGALSSVKPDKLSNYEIGAKGTLFDGRLSLETALYYMDWQDIKSQLQVGTFPVFVNALVNGTSASGVGADVAVTSRPINRLEIGGSVSWNDLTTDEDIFTGGRLLLSKGDRMSWSPETTANGFVQYSFPIGSLTAHLQGTVNYLSTWNNVQPGPALGSSPIVRSSDSLTTTAARVTVDSDNGWSVSLFGDNLKDENGVAAPNPGDTHARIPPRTIGIQVEYHWH